MGYEVKPIYHIRLLGPPQVDKDGAPLPAFRTQKTSALLGYLVRQQQPVYRSYLADLLWGDHSETRGRRNLSNELSYLSTHLPGLFEADRQTIHFQPTETYWIDTAAFEKLVEESRGTGGRSPAKASRGSMDDSSPSLLLPRPSVSLALTEALAFYRGDFMAGCTLSDCPEFESWLQAEQEYWRRRVGEVLAGLIEHHAGQKEDDLAQAYTRRWLALEPWREEAHRYLMVLLARNGQRSAALAQYESCRRILAEELAVEPAAETAALVEQIRRGELSGGATKQGLEATLLLGGQMGREAALRGGSPVALSLTPVGTNASGLAAREPGKASAAFLSSVTAERRNQLILLNKVKNFWVRGVLDQTLRDAPRLELVRRPCPEAIEQPWAQVVESLPPDSQPIPPEKSTLDLFQEADDALLILGTPGVGKTITLIELARELIALAEDDPGRPIPVILNLSSWSEHRAVLADWVVEELTAKYQIPRQMGRAWLENNELLLLLDGFDEIAVKHQPAGARAINQFRETHGLTGLVVCSRTNAFEAGSFRLRLGGAITLQPLTLAQIDQYLAASGAELRFLRVALQREAEYGGTELCEVLESPLMLSVIRLAYREAGALGENVPTGAVLPAGATDDIRRHLFSAYIGRMLHRRGGGPYPAGQTESWLAWLAQKMFQHNQTIFLLEQFQPGWLPSRRWRWLFLLSYRIIESLAVGVVGWAHLLFYETYAPEVARKAAGLITWLVPFRSGSGALLGAMLIALGLSLMVAVFDGFYFEWLNHRADSTQAAHLQIGHHLIVAGLTGSIPAIIISAASPASLWIALYVGVFSGGGYGILSYLVHEQSFHEAIRAVEKVSWSWSGALKGALVGLVFGVVLQIVAWQFIPVLTKGVEVLWVITFFIIVAAQGRSLEIKNTPNQGIKLSAKNGLFACLLAGLGAGLMGWLSLDGYNGLRFGLAGLITWWLLYGGGNVIRHYLLRLLLWASGDIPWNYTRFLDYAAERVLLRKVGGGYMFVHRLLQAYFANLREVKRET